MTGRYGVAIMRAIAHRGRGHGPRARRDSSSSWCAASEERRTLEPRTLEPQNLRTFCYVVWNAAVPRVRRRRWRVASTTLYFFLLAISIFFSLLIAGLIVFYADRATGGATADSVGAVIHGGMVLEITWTVDPVRHHDGHLRLGRERVLRDVAAAGRDAEHLRRRQAVDVEVPAPRRPARDQRAARAGRPAGEADHDVRRT